MLFVYAIILKNILDMLCRTIDIIFMVFRCLLSVVMFILYFM